ncbi:2-keto-4-pentenoate hydratase [Rhizobium sp. ERR 922]|uniref:2-keto-4-pentenoate hydratase n=1 Tax=unclassified Rhizobium TaxID=2613769 RepID=UPI0011AE07A1|nr:MULTISPECIES: fumarylacetoacetate hydrolase family protein [unclassified Rhizobium]TWB53097.1 2-keto-4-pentenoate hydratase [Rhizobium sp. ERR 922]TWB95938.1 2-keto-4-pentenoate hydratase [Rhizobium sp. ERR 942]
MISPRTDLLAQLFVDARRSGVSLASLPHNMEPITPEEADAVQDATVTLLGDTVGGYKVAQVAAAPGSWGAIIASRLIKSPARAIVPARGLCIEIELAFEIGRDLPGRGDGQPYGADEVRDAITGACTAFELVKSRLAAHPKPAPAVARADMMSNWGLVFGEKISDWGPAVHADLAVNLDIDGRPVVVQRGGHPSGDPFHPIIWLANALVSRGRGLTAGQIVTTGSFGGSHPLPAGAIANGSIAGFAPICFEAGR